MFKEKVLILEITGGEYEGNVWQKVKARSTEIAGNRILSYKVNLKKAGSIEKYLDQSVMATFDVEVGANDSAVLKIVAVEG